MTPRCDHCPVSGTCIVERNGHRRYCDLADAGYGDRIKELSAEADLAAPTESPPILDQVGNVVSALGRVGGQLLTGATLTVSQEEYDRRLTICRSCPEYQPCGPRCRKCGCFLQVKARLESESGQCPLKKW